jgi:hypothetical protein
VEVDLLEAVEAAAEANSSKGEDDDVCFFCVVGFLVFGGLDVSDPFFS